jgi:hypothetical protein
MLWNTSSRHHLAARMSNVPRPRAGSDSALTGGIDSDLYLGVRPGESDSGRMLGAILLLVMAMVALALGLAWWLA